MAKGESSCQLGAFGEPSGPLTSPSGGQALGQFARAEVEAHFQRWRAATDRRDLDEMALLLAEDARGGNAIFGVVEGRDAIVDFMQNWPAEVPNRSVWYVIDGARVVNKWRETLPGTRPDGRAYDYFGISEFIYCGGGQWSFIYGLPDQVGLLKVHARWRADGQAEIHDEVYPGIPWAGFAGPRPGRRVSPAEPQPS